MSAYTHFHRDQFNPAQNSRLKTAFGSKDSPYMAAQRSIPCISGPQLKFLNPGACQYVNPYSKTFWPDLKTWLTPISRQAASYPQARSYRRKLEPYLLQKVTLTAAHWNLKSTHEANGLLRLMLTDIRLSHVYSGGGIKADPNRIVILSHMNIWVSPTWMNLLPAYGHQVYDAPLTVTGILYEYVSRKGIRNIGILPVLLEPKGPNPAARQNRRVKCPDSPECPGIFA